MHTIRLRNLISALCLMPLSACWVTSQTGDRMLSDIDALQKHTYQSRKTLEQQGAQLTEQRQQLDEQMKVAQSKIEEVATVLDTLNRAARMTDADFGVQIERLIQEVQELRGTLELADFRLGQMEQHFAEESSIVTRIEALEQKLDAATLAVGKKRSSAKSSGGKKPKDKKSLLGYAQQLVKDGKEKEARGVYREVIRKWPKNQGVTDEAYFRLGELYYQSRKYRSALQEYIHVAEKFRKSSFVDDAYYRIGICSMKIGSYKDAEIFFNALIKEYPKSPLIKAAKTKIQEVRAKLDSKKKKIKT